MGKWPSCHFSAAPTSSEQRSGAYVTSTKGNKTRLQCSLNGDLERSVKSALAENKYLRLSLHDAPAKLER